MRIKKLLRSIVIICGVAVLILSYKIQSRTEIASADNGYVSRGILQGEIYYNEIDIPFESIEYSKLYIEEKETYTYTVSEKAVAGYEVCTTKVKKVKEEKEKSYTDEELSLLAGIIENEAGGDFCESDHQKAIASVVLNRVKSEYYPDTIREVIYEKGQYAINEDRFNNPSKRAIKNAKYVLENGSTLPDNCIFQSEFKQGDGVYIKFETVISTTYICYKDKE